MKLDVGSCQAVSFGTGRNLETDGEGRREDKGENEEIRKNQRGKRGDKAKETQRRQLKGEKEEVKENIR